MTTPRKAQDRLDVLRRIDEYERKGLFSHDVEDDPPTVPLEADQVDYLGEKLSSRIMTALVNCYGKHFINGLIRSRRLIIKEVRGIGNFTALGGSGAVITCNHFNAYDNFAVYKAIEKPLGRRRLYKVIREGNYTSFPGVYGLFFRHCNTLPLSSRSSTMRKFMSSVDILLRRGEKILVYAEQGMWWNYRKPRPLTNGAFKFAVSAGVPVIPFFITMEDSAITGEDGFPVQEYTVHILEPIFPDPALSCRGNVDEMKRRNYTAWKDVYEKTYGIPLVYSAEGD